MTANESVLCVGGAGFIGSHLAHAIDQAHAGTCTVADVWEGKLRLRYDNQHYRYVDADIREEGGSLDRLVAEADVVFNLASFAFPKHYVERPLEVVQLNLMSGVKVIEACVARGKRLIHFSTSEVYGKTGGSEAPFREDESDCILGPIVKQRWIYSCTKQLLDRIIYAHGRQSGLDYTIVRPFNVVGPLQDYLMAGPEDGCPRVFAQFMSALLNGEPLRLVDGGKSRRCFTDIDDVIAALMTILARPEAANRQILNIGNPANETTIRDLALTMREIYREKFLKPGERLSDVVDVPADDFYGAGYEDSDRRLPDIAKMTALGWRPKVGLTEIFEKAMTHAYGQRDRLTRAALGMAD